MRDLAALLTAIETAIDAEPSLTRARHGHGGKFIESPELAFRRSGWTARCKLRGVGEKKHGARLMTDVHGDGETPELAAAALIESLSIWKEVLK